MLDSFFKEGVTLCKTIMRNGFDAHIVNTPLQHRLISTGGKLEIDLCTDITVDELAKLFPALENKPEDTQVLGELLINGCLYRFYAMHEDNVAPESILTRRTLSLDQRFAEYLRETQNQQASANRKQYAGFLSMDQSICFAGHPEETLRSNYLLGIQAMRHSANFDLPIEQNSWMAIVSSAQRIADYLSAQQIMSEWRCVAAENMWLFTQLLFNSQIMHALIPEVAGLARVRHTKNDSGVEEAVIDHTFACMRYYPQGEFTHDWLGVFAMLFHDVGKLYTGEYYNGRWTFYQHHRVGAKITRVILRRLRMPADEIDLICELIRNHMRFQFMMTDKGIRRFKLIESHNRLIEMSRANIQAREDNYTAFNHNNKYLTRAETPEQMLEPLLNGNEIMEVTGLTPGPHVGLLRQALLQAQIAGQVNTIEEATNFVKIQARAI